MERIGAVFLDRDGTINRRPPAHEYVTDAAQLELLPGAIDAMGQLARAGWRLVVISNQRGVARGLVDIATLQAVENTLQEMIGRMGQRVAAFYYCTHDIDDGCTCRKPKPGLLLAAAREHGLDLEASWMVGDSTSDVAAGRTAGCQTILLGEDTQDLAGAASMILACCRSGPIASQASA